MAGFGFTEAEEMFRREVQGFVRRELVPGAKERAKLDRIPQETIQKLADMGLLGICLPEEWGGQGADWLSVGIALEEVAKAEICTSLLLILPGVVYLALGQTQEPAELMKEWLPPTIRGEKLSSFAVTEPDAGADAAGIKMTAVRDGDCYVLNGEKTSASLGTYAHSGMVFAKTDPTAKARGITCFWVPYDLPGISRSLLPHTGMKPLGSASIMFDDVRLPDKYRIGEEGKGFYVFGQAVNYQRVCCGLMTLGSAQNSLEETMNYALQRTAFGQPIGRFEGVSFKIAEHATRIEAARMLCYQTLSYADQGLPIMKEAAMCKWWCPVVAFDAIHDCVLLHGHLGYSEEYPLEQRLRDVMGLEFMDSVAQVMKVIVARELLGKTAASF